jgi:hypothetical protein
MRNEKKALARSDQPRVISTSDPRGDDRDGSKL